MNITAETAPSRRRNSSPILSHRDEFARDAALDAFGRGAIHHLNNAVFQDRDPLDEVQDPDEAVDGRQAVAHWLSLAANLEDDEAQTAFDTADELRRVLNLSWTDVLGRDAA